MSVKSCRYTYLLKLNRGQQKDIDLLEKKEFMHRIECIIQ